METLLLHGSNQDQLLNPSLWRSISSVMAEFSTLSSLCFFYQAFMVFMVFQRTINSFHFWVYRLDFELYLSFFFSASGNLPVPLKEGFPGDGSGKEPTCQCRRPKRHEFYPWVGEIPMATHSSILTWRIPMDRGAWWATVHRVTKSQTRLKQCSKKL